MRIDNRLRIGRRRRNLAPEHEHAADPPHLRGRPHQSFLSRTARRVIDTFLRLTRPILPLVLLPCPVRLCSHLLLGPRITSPQTARLAANLEAEGCPSGLTQTTSSILPNVPMGAENRVTTRKRLALVRSQPTPQGRRNSLCRGVATSATVPPTKSLMCDSLVVREGARLAHLRGI